MLRLIARILEALLMMIDPESGNRLIDSRKPPKPQKQPMSDKRFEQIWDLVFMIMAMSAPFVLVALFVIAICLTGK